MRCSKLPASRRIDPCLAGYAALGLARAAATTCDQRHRDAALTWLGWYADAMDEAGHVDDHVVVDGVERSTGEADSTDAYAGLFLMAAHAVQILNPTDRRTIALAPAVDRAVDATRATTGADGLSRARPDWPDWPVAYLMDQAEAAAGPAAAASFQRTNGRWLTSRDTWPTPSRPAAARPASGTRRPTPSTGRSTTTTAPVP